MKGRGLLNKKFRRKGSLARKESQRLVGDNENRPGNAKSEVEDNSCSEFEHAGDKTKTTASSLTSDSSDATRITHHKRTRARDALRKLVLLRRTASQETLAATTATTTAATALSSSATLPSSSSRGSHLEHQPQQAHQGQRHRRCLLIEPEREFQIFENERVLCDSGGGGAAGLAGSRLRGKGVRRCRRDGEEKSGPSLAKSLGSWFVSWMLEKSSDDKTDGSSSSLLLADGFLVLLLLRVMPQLYLVAILHLVLVVSASLLKKVLRRIYLSLSLTSSSYARLWPHEGQQGQQGRSPKRFTFRREGSAHVSFPPSLREQPLYRPAATSLVLESQVSSDVSQLTFVEEEYDEEEGGGGSDDGGEPKRSRAGGATGAVASSVTCSDDEPEPVRRESHVTSSPLSPPSTPQANKVAEDSSSSYSFSSPGSPMSSSSSSSSPYDAKMTEQIRYMISQLSDDEQELAARTNYTYFTTQDPELRQAAVMHMCARYLRSKKVPDTALAKMKETLAFRKEMNVDHLRLALRGDNVAKCETAQKLKSHVEHKAVYVQGYDREGRSTFIFEPHRVLEYCHEISLKHHVWTLERAIACSRHPDKTINAVINCGEFVAKHHAPPVQLAKDFFKALRSHYTGHVNKIFLVAPPRSVGFLWSVFKPFVSERTKNNVVFVTRPNQLAEFYCVTQAKPWMLTGGLLKEDLDVEEYIERPFDTAYT